MIPQANVESFVERYKAESEAIGLSFFEWTVGLAFDHFRSEEVDVAVIEVGMGGRLDSTNVITPQLSIITNIGWDHMQFLGDSLDKIAKEKAGIIKRGQPVVVGRSQRETEGVFRSIALKLDAPISFADQQFPMDIPESPLTAGYQSENVQTVLIAAQTLQQLGWNIREAHIVAGFKHVMHNTGLRGRWETLSEAPLVICDVGHNVEGITGATQQLARVRKGTLYLILGFVADKDVKQLLSLFPKDATYLLTAPAIPRALSIADLSELATGMKIKHDLFHGVADAYSAALEWAKPEDTIFVGGSTFVVADLLAAL
jgi:dihydrofolate synthase/folylpolyglutamate synthase